MKRLLLALLLLATLPAHAAITQYNIMSFGAKGNGTSDDAPAFKAALAAMSQNGGVLLCPPPPQFYAIGSAIRITNAAGITIQGMSSVSDAYTGIQPTVIKLLANADCNILEIGLNCRVNIQGIVFDGNRTHQSVTGLYGIFIDGNSSVIDRVALSDVVIQHVAGTGLHNLNRETMVNKLTVYDCLAHGIYNSASSDTPWKDIQSGFNGGVGLLWEGVNYSQIQVANIYRNYIGMVLTNCSNNEFWSLQVDAAETDGLILSSGGTGGSYCTGNDFYSAKPIVANFPYTHDYTPLTVSSVPNGTYSNLKLIGNNTIANNFYGGRGFAYENINTNHRPKMLIEDLRPLYATNNIQGTQFRFSGFQITTNTSFFVQEAFSTNFVRCAELDWWRDFSPQWKDNTFLRQLSVNQQQVSDQFRSANGVQANADYGTNGWVYVDGVATNMLPAYWLRMRTDGTLGFMTATPGVADALLTWVPAFTVNPTNNYTAFNNGETAAVTPLEVNGTAKASLMESRDGITFNAYYDGSWIRRSTGYAGNIYFQYDTNTPGATVFNTAIAGDAGSAITFVPYMSVDTSGNITMPQTLTAGTIAASTLNLTTLNTGTLGVTNSITASNLVLSATSGPLITLGSTNAAPSVTNAVLWIKVHYGASDYAMPLMALP